MYERVDATVDREVDGRPRDQAEHLERLRAHKNGWRIQVLRASAPAFGIDTRADYDAFLARRNANV